MSKVSELVLKNRSYRRFDESHAVSREVLLELVDLARLSGSGANRQPFKFFLSADPETNGRIFPHLKWAAFLKDWDGPGPGEKPAAYIVVLVDQNISKEVSCEDGLAIQSMLLGAVEKGLGGCILGTIDREKIRAGLSIAGHLKIHLVVALGKPAETVVVDELGPDGDTKYRRDDRGVHHVPKRKLEDLIVG